MTILVENTAMAFAFGQLRRLSAECISSRWPCKMANQDGWPQMPPYPGQCHVDRPRASSSFYVLCLYLIVTLLLYYVGKTLNYTFNYITCLDSLISHWHYSIGGVWDLVNLDWNALTHHHQQEQAGNQGSRSCRQDELRTSRGNRRES